ncbi:MAG: helix-turn-helix transcriptional regulator [Lachnospiraceae bacterium]|nr:helix-turn-helix transcriptional regulator [Lachnospiraceae bacterium]
MGRTYREFLNEKLEDPEFKKEWDELEPEYQLIKAMIHARDEQKISQRQLSDMTGITQADISKMESGEANPTLQTIKRVAKGLGMKLELVFTPMAGVNKV